MVRKAHRHGAQHTAHGKLRSVHKKTKPPIVVADQTEMLTTDIVKHQRVSHSGGTCAGGGMRCGPRSIFVWYTAADAAGNADGLKPTKHDSISKRIGNALLKLLAHGVCYVPNGTARVPTQEHSPGPETASPSRRRRLDSSLSTTRTSPSASEVAYAQNNKVNSAEELVNRRCSPVDNMQQRGRRKGAGYSS